MREIKHIETTTPSGVDDIIEFLNSNGIKAEKVELDKYGYSRTIGFIIYGVYYRIVWYVNESKLLIGADERAARIPFKFIYLDDTYPLVGGNRSIGFSYNKLEVRSWVDRLFPYEVFRIPVEI